MHFVGAAVALLPHQNSGVVGDHRDQKQVEGPRNHLQQAVGHRQERVSKAFGVAENQRRDAVQQGESGDHDERRRFHQPLEFDLHRAPELQPFRDGAEISGGRWNRRGGDRNALLSLDLLISWTPLRETESPVGEGEDHGSDPQPDQPVPEHVSGVSDGQRVLLGDGPVFGRVQKRVNAKGIDQCRSF